MSSVAASHTSSHVSAIGRLGARFQIRELPSGDVLTTFTVIVDRARSSHSDSPHGGGGARVDAIACVTTRTRVREAVERWDPGTLVEITGALRRRFWRGGGGALGSAMDVDVRTMRRA